jgi:hypothetical protein
MNSFERINENRERARKMKGEKENRGREAKDTMVGDLDTQVIRSFVFWPHATCCTIENSCEYIISNKHIIATREEREQPPPQ